MQSSPAIGDEVRMAQAVDSTVRSLREQILSGDIPTGTRLGEAELAGRLAVSRTPVREALSRLAAEGLVDLVPNRGARVATWTTDALREIFDLRLAVEPAIVSLAVPKLDADALAELDTLARTMNRHGRPGKHQDLDELTELNRRFHDGFVRAADNTAFASSLRTVVHAAVVRRNFEDYDAASLARSLDHHLELVAAARVGDAEWAAAIMRAHLFNARATMLRATP